MLVGDGLEVDFGLDDVEQRTLRSFIKGFGGVEHVVGARRHLGGMLLRRTDSTERLDSNHIIQKLKNSSNLSERHLFQILVSDSSLRSE
jgi:hypothetical protein